MFAPICYKTTKGKTWQNVCLPKGKAKAEKDELSQAFWAFLWKIYFYHRGKKKNQFSITSSLFPALNYEQLQSDTTYQQKLTKNNEKVKLFINSYSYIHILNHGNTLVIGI